MTPDLVQGSTMNRTTGWIFALLMGALAMPVFAQSGRGGVVYTNRKRFAIPFQTDADEIRRLGANEMRLFVSVDGGRRFVKVQSVRPNVRKFTVQAPRDGAYWFAVRTVDRNNQLHPKVALSAELKVVVDTTSPTLKLSLSQPNPGQVTLTWQAADRNLKTSSLVLEAREAGQTKWQPVRAGNKAAGSTTWNVPKGGIVQVRGKISDSADNTAVGQDSRRIAPGNNKQLRPRVPNFNDPIASSNSKSNSGSGDSSMPSKFPTGSGNGGTAHPFGKTQRPSSNGSDNNTGSGGVVEPKSIAKQQDSSQKPFTRFPNVSQTKPVKPKIPTKLVNSRKFRLNYTLERVGKSGVQAVELFITQDGGQKWYRYGIDEDRTSPISVKVPDDGTYGFALRVRSGVGLAVKPPQPGEEPEVYVTVDQTAPKIEMLPVLQGQGRDSHKFLLRWRVSDDNPHSSPIAIAYSESAKGPWKTISDWTDAAGKHLWTTPANAPAKVYIRIAARDAAGNISFVQTPRPVIIDDVKPRARITNVEPGSAGR